jgi:hypothetical protein
VSRTIFAKLQHLPWASTPYRFRVSSLISRTAMPQLFNELRFSQVSSDIKRNFMSIQNKTPNKYCRLQESPKVLSMPDTPTKISIKIATITELQHALTTGTIGKIPDAFTFHPDSALDSHNDLTSTARGSSQSIQRSFPPRLVQLDVLCQA